MTMKITIEYESTWRNSFLSGSNNGPMDKAGRAYLGSMTSLKAKENRIDRGITKNTIMGLLNRLIGDQRKLYQARQDESYYFKDLESRLTEEHFVDAPVENDELIFIRNLSGSRDKNSFTGLIKSKHPQFNSPYSRSLWSLPFMSVDQVVGFIKTGSYVAPVDAPANLNALVIADKLDELSSLKGEDVSPQWQEAIDVLKIRFPNVNYNLTASNKFRPFAFYASAMYLLAGLLSQAHDLSNLFTQNGLISGISKRSFTRGDFMQPFVTGEKKLVYGNPYLIVDRVKGQGEVRKKLTTASGVLTINLPLATAQAVELKNLIDNAGVSAIRLGKKGLAYISEITIDGVVAT